MMKKVAMMLLVVMLLTLASPGQASEGVAVIGGQKTKQAAVVLDDIKLGAFYEIEDFAWIEPVEFKFVDCFAQFNKDSDYYATGWNHDKSASTVYYDEEMIYFHQNAAWQDSGKSADFAWLQADVTNTTKADATYLKNTSVKVVFDNEYEYQGWIRQFSYDYSNVCYRPEWNGKTASPVVSHPSNEEAVSMLYTGHFVFGCTLPNNVVNGDEPLRMVIKIGNHEMTYHIRK